MNCSPSDIKVNMGLLGKASSLTKGVDSLWLKEANLQQKNSFGFFSQFPEALSLSQNSRHESGARR